MKKDFKKRMSGYEDKWENNIYHLKRAFDVCDVVGICPTTREEFVETIFSVPREPVSATIDLVGVPAVITAKSDSLYADMYNNATMTAIDGMPFVRKARRKGYKCERCSGPDVMDMVFEEGIKRGAKHYFYGGKNDEVLSKLRSNLEKNHPGINIVGMYSPPFRPLTDEENEQVVNEINSLQPDFVWVGIGAPKQEMWMWQHRDSIHGTCMLGVGAAFDFLAGTLSKAPAWMEKSGIEWLYRLCKEPKRLWRRYLLGGIKYLYYSAQSGLKGIFGKKK